MEEALSQSKRGLELDPVSIGSNYNYAASLIQAGHLQEGPKHLESLIERDPENEVAYGYLGIAYNRMGRHEDAARNYELALKRVVDTIWGTWAAMAGA
jgi:predicted Zn-dependent protease